MTETFTASNGVKLDRYGSIMSGFSAASLDDVHAARKEFYRHLEDVRLGRERDPEESDYVVYPHAEDAQSDEFANPIDLTIINEATGERMFYTRAEDDGHKRGHPWESPRPRVARAYFQRHPEPKPWHDAKVGEAWLLIVNGKEEVYVKEPGGWFRGAFFGIDPVSPRITAGRRIYPVRRNYPEED